MSRDLILLVDDEPDNRVMMRYFFESWGYDVEVAENGEQTLAAVSRTKPSLVLLDLEMPVMDGFETCRRLKEDADTESIPVILFTARDATESKVKGLRSGAEDYVVKSIEPEELRARVDGVLRRSRRYEASRRATTDGDVRAREGEPVLAGSLEEKSFPEALQLALAYGQTGVLALEDGPRRGRVYLDRGEVVFADSAGRVERSGEDAFDDLTLWTRGSFRYLVGAAAPGRNVSVPATTLLLEATRRLDEWTFLSTKIPHFDAVPHRVAVSADADPIRLSRADWDLLRIASGRSSIRQLADALGQDVFETGRTVFGLLAMGVLSLDPQRREEETLLASIPELVESPALREPYELSGAEWKILSLVDGERDLSTIVTLAGLAPAELASSVKSLNERGLVRLGPISPEDEPPPTRTGDADGERQNGDGLAVEATSQRSRA